MDSGEAALRCQRMWKRLGTRFEREAYARANQENAIDRQQAILAAKVAEACFWQSTGESEAFDLDRSEPING